MIESGSRRGGVVNVEDADLICNCDFASIGLRVAELRKTYASQSTRTYQWRIKQLKQLLKFIDEHEKDLIDALAADLGRSNFAAKSECHPIREEIQEAIERLSHWMKPVKKDVILLCQPGTAYVEPEPLGVVLILSAWNFPVDLILHPLVGALAAGNTALVKPSEVAVHTSNIFATCLLDYFPPNVVCALTGGVEITTEILKHKFDHIFYTGNSNIARIIMNAASQHLTPVTLELGGKSPVVVASDADLSLTARRVMWSKLLNAGQLCIAPDYVLVEQSVLDPFQKACAQQIDNFYGDHPELSPDLGKIVNKRHVLRLLKLLKGLEKETLVGGKVDADKRYVSPTIVINPPLDSPIMNEEIFGPILVIIGVPSIDYAIHQINLRPKPLTLYIFSSNKAIQQKIIHNTSSGSVVVNDCFMQVINPSLPFGGVGESGMGCYHGRYTFDTFSHHKAVLCATTLDFKVKYPPYTPTNVRLVQFLMFVLPRLVNTATTKLIFLAKVAGLSMVVGVILYKIGLF